MAFPGITALPPIGERSWVSVETERQIDEIEAGEREFLEFVERWAHAHDGDCKAIAGYLDNFLADYFYDRRREIDAELDLVGLPPHEDHFKAERDRLIANLSGRLP